jgi:hypothetical protein
MAYLLGVPVAPESDDFLEVEVDPLDVYNALGLAAPLDSEKLSGRSHISLDEALTSLSPRWIRSSTSSSTCRPMRQKWNLD